MERKNTTLDEDRLVRYLSDKLHAKSARLDDMSPVLQKLMMVHEKVEDLDGDIEKLLLASSGIEDIKLRRWFRKGVLAQLYDVNEYDMDDGMPYISAANSHCALLQMPGETIILNTDGSIRQVPYPVKLFDSTVSNWGWVTKEKGHDNHKRGMYSLEGYEMMPCAFDDIEIGEDENPIACIAGYRFKFIPGFYMKYATEEQKAQFKARVNRGVIYSTEDGFLFSFDEDTAEVETLTLVMPGVRVSKNYAETRGLNPASPIAKTRDDAIRMLRFVMNEKEK